MLLDKKKITIREMRPDDWPTVALIYKLGMDTGVATFEESVPEYEQWDTSHLKICRLVAIIEGQIAGWAALSPVSSRCVYGGVAELSVYINPSFWGNGVGSTLLKQLIASSENKGYWSLQAGVFPQNTASIALHKKLGFREIGYREKIAKKDGIWYDNILLERRSKKIGIN